ncbi:4-alpha-glucanotransferase [Stenotrophomonas sp. 278]|uniref:4-alpha-glucanotransferase n=1 Tax=Stenotrophomonas sp. 278 TaxID=2479851 RepID=UPI000F68B4FF|nr:4-alpha-glucanotransferase [Stenotrophomonas sp. 278]RRU23902.1 4-alpha-glucanotransferase [Stenotrophomonas sp. 278]
MKATASLKQQAQRAGVMADWVDVTGSPQTVDPGVLAEIVSRLPEAAPVVPPLLTGVVERPVHIAGSRDADAVWVDDQGHACVATPQGAGSWRAPSSPGYWRWEQGGLQQAVAVAPLRAWYPAQNGHARDWGLAAQVYSLRHAGDGGIGDSAGALDWVRRLGAQGGSALALSPIHAAMPIRSGHSPYSPSDRLALEALHAAPLQVLPEAAAAVRGADPSLDEALAAHERAERIDWPAAAAAKQAWIDRLPDWLQHHDPVSWRQICADIVADDPSPEERQAAFGRWLARTGWQRVQQQARTAQLRIGLIADLAVGFDPEGAEARRNTNAVLQGLELGAPPDAFNPLGQSWGITGYAPQALVAQGYAPFIALLRAVMADRGGIRIDHILGLNRLWVVPRGAGAAQGAYLRYPFQDLINLLVLESWRHGCIVIGEDLGVVPPGIRDTLAGRGILGIDVLAFSRDTQGFWPPSRWRSTAVAMSSTHDLPPVAGWLAGRDLDWHAQLGWSDATAAHALRDERARQAAELHALARTEGIGSDDPHSDALALTALASAPLALLPLEDALGLSEQPNLPGTVHEHPNWQQRLPTVDDPGLEPRLKRFARLRGGETA